MMKDHPVENPTSVGWIWLCRAPLLLASALIVLLSIYSVSRLATANSPRDPWEATEVLDAWRSLQGLPVYELSPDGHSTHMYGALVPWVQGAIFRWVGPNNISGRILSLISAITAVTILAVTMRGQRSAWFLAIAWAAILGVNYRSGQYFAENRPDMTALMFAAAGVLMLGYGQENRRGHWVVVGTACLVIGFFFKQTAFIFAVVPLLALTLRWRRPTPSEFHLALIPLAASIGVVLGLRWMNPTIYHYMIDVPLSFPLDVVRSVRCLWDLLLDSPLFLVLLGEWLVLDGGSLRKDPRVLWVIAVLVVTIPFSAVATGKVGGASNSLLPALLAMMTFCVLRLPRLLDRMEQPCSCRGSRLALGSFLSLLMLMTAFPHMTRGHNPIAPLPEWDREYLKAVAIAKALPGKVISPEDPTIAFYAKGYVGLNLSAEYDTHLVNGYWPNRPPEPLLSEILNADHIVDLSYPPELGESNLGELGFEAMGDIPLDPKCYRVWRRRTRDTTLSAHDPKSNPR